ncbi:MAG: hypothetical protein LBF79_00285, partial [Dysgonamonadaceae bacterium]|nr:hypothetical protein [Dysgonamonadaceae bacterium]
IDSAQTIQNIIKDFPEEELYEFAKRFFPSEGEFIIAYVRHLDKLPETGILQGKVGSDFHKVKWIFVFTALGEMPESSFNRRYFVSETLHGLAARYNLAYFDLLVYFHAEQTAMQLPVRLLQVLDELYRQEKMRWATVALKSGNEPDRFRMLATLVPKEQQFVKTYIRALDFYRTKTALQGKTSGNFTQVKWKFIFDVLLEIRHVAFNKKQFVSRALRQLAAHYNLSFREILEYVAVLTDLPGKQEFAEIGRIIKELHSDEIVQSSLQTKNKLISETIAKLSCRFVNNAGIALLSPYLPRLFEMLKLTEEGGFKDSEAQIRAMFLIQYIIFGSPLHGGEEAGVGCPETEMTLNKILTGFNLEVPIPQTVELSDTERDTVRSMFQGVLSNWDKMKNTSVEGFRAAFLQREGKLEETDDCYLLTPEEKSYDILLDVCPWGFKTIKYKWMEKRIQVKWR